MRFHVIIFSVLISIFSCFGVEVADSMRGIGLDEVVVTGSNRSVNSDELPYSLSVITGADLESSGSGAVLSILSGRVPSLFVTERSIGGFGVSSNGGAGHIKMRGVGGDRASAVLMMVDGQPQFAGIYSHHVADFYNKEYVERVEVLRGPGSVLYGSNALAGVINVITRDSDRNSRMVELKSEYGSFNTWETSLMASGSAGALSGMLSVSYDRTDGNINGMLFKQWTGYGKLSYKLSKQWKINGDVTLMNFVADDPVYPRLSNPESEDVYHQNITRGESSVALSNDYGSSSGVARIYYNWGNHYIDDPRHFHSLDDRMGILLYQNFTPWRGASATAGFDMARYSGEIPVSGGKEHEDGSLSTIGRKVIAEYSPYITLSQGIKNVDLNGGVRLACSNMFAARFVPQVGIVYRPGKDYILKGSASMGYRNPSFRELYLYRMANPDLEPERMWNYELSVSKMFLRRLNVEVTGYYCRGTNMIEVTDMHNRNTGSFINKGIELTAQVHISPTLRISAMYSYLNSSLYDLTGAPRHQYFVGADWRVRDRFILGIQLKGVSRLYVAEDEDLQSYALLNFKGEYRVWKGLWILCRLDNITSARYVINRGYTMPGFTAMGGFKLKI